MKKYLKFCKVSTCTIKMLLSLPFQFLDRGTKFFYNYRIRYNFLFPFCLINTVYVVSIEVFCISQEWLVILFVGLFLYIGVLYIVCDISRWSTNNKECLSWYKLSPRSLYKQQLYFSCLLVFRVLFYKLKCISPFMFNFVSFYELKTSIVSGFSPFSKHTRSQLFLYLFR